MMIKWTSEQAGGILSMPAHTSSNAITDRTKQGQRIFQFQKHTLTTTFSRPTHSQQQGRTRNVSNDVVDYEAHRNYYIKVATKPVFARSKTLLKAIVHGDRTNNVIRCDCAPSS
eukprot:1343124-Amphidinium_carterae.1